MNTYRSKNPNDERKWISKDPYDDVLQVGTHKSMGYVLLKSNEELNNLLLRLPTNKLVKIMESKSRHGSIKLCVGDEGGIQLILNNHLDLLNRYCLPTNAKDMFNLINENIFYHYENIEFYHVINKLFNSWCLKCEI